MKQINQIDELKKSFNEILEFPFSRKEAYVLIGSLLLKDLDNPLKEIKKNYIKQYVLNQRLIFEKSKA